MSISGMKHSHCVHQHGYKFKVQLPVKFDTKFVTEKGNDSDDSAPNRSTQHGEGVLSQNSDRYIARQMTGDSKNSVSKHCQRQMAPR